MQYASILIVLALGMTVSASPLDLTHLKATPPIVLSSRDFVLHGGGHEQPSALHEHDEKKKDLLLKKIAEGNIRAAEVTLSKTFRFFYEDFKNDVIHKEKTKQLHDKIKTHGAGGK